MITKKELVDLLWKVEDENEPTSIPHKHEIASAMLKEFDKEIRKLKKNIKKGVR